MKNKKVKMTFEVIVPLDDITDEKSLKEDFKGDIFKLTKLIFKEEGFWWKEETKLVKSKLIK